MGKKKRLRQTAIRHQAYLPSTESIITFGPTTRKNTTIPFCAYYGPSGETCSITTGLEVVLSLPSIPPAVFLACPFHYDTVRKQAEAFLATLPSDIKRSN